MVLFDIRTQYLMFLVPNSDFGCIRMSQNPQKRLFHPEKEKLTITKASPRHLWYQGGVRGGFLCNKTQFLSFLVPNW